MTVPASGTGPLTGIRIVEIAGIGPLPFAGMLMADMGAEIVLIDRPGSPPSDDAMLRGRQRVALDLKTSDGLAALRELAAGADMLIEGLRPGVMERLGAGPEALIALNPRLVYGRMTGWGQDGPRAHTAGHDINYIALTGALSAIGTKQGGPVPPLNLVGDFGGGALYLVAGVLAALLSAKATGRGQVVDAAIVDGTLSLMTMMLQFLDKGQWIDERASNLIDNGSPFYGTFRCRDGAYITLAPIEAKFWREFCALTGFDPAVADPRRPASWPQARRAIEALIANRTSDEWQALFDGTDVCFAPVRTMSEARQDPHVVARQGFVPFGDRSVPAPAPRFTATPSTLAAGLVDADPVAIAQRWNDESNRAQ